MSNAIKISYKTLTGLLGKSIDDPAVAAMITKAGKLTVKSDFIVGYDGGFDFALQKPDGAKRSAKKVLSCLFLFSEGRDKHRGYQDLPKPFAFGPREELLAAAGAPTVTFEIGKGNVLVTTKDPHRDTWHIDGLEVSANYREGVATYFTVAPPKETTRGRSLSSSPLHFETEPVDAPKDARLVGMGLLVAWGVDRFGLPAKHATDLGREFAKRALTPVSFLKAACESTLSTLDFAPELGAFLHGYTHRMFLTCDEGARDPMGRTIKRWLDLSRDDERVYADDFLGTFKAVVKSPFYVPDTWTAADRIAPVLDARWADYSKTKFETPPDLKLYEKAATLRDKVAITPAKEAPLASSTVDDRFATELVQLIDRPLSDKAVQAALGRAGLPMGKKIDEQANPLLGVSYLGVKVPVNGKRVMGVEGVTFYATNQTSYIRGLGKEVEFRGYPSSLPLGVTLGDTRGDVRKRFGTPKQEAGDIDYWFPCVDRRIIARYDKNDRLVRLNFGKPADWLDPPKPPFAPKGLFQAP